MDMISSFKPSMDRIFGNKQPELRSSFQTILLVLQGIEEIISKSPDREYAQRKLSMLTGSIRRHFHLENNLMVLHKYDEYSTETHINKHRDFIDTVELFEMNFFRSKPEQNMTAYRGIQKWLLHHLLMEDAHFMQKTFGK